MDNEQILQFLHDLPLEEGRVFLREHLAEINDPVAFGKRIFDKALDLRSANPTLSLKLAELLISLGEQIPHTMTHARGLRAKGNALNYMRHHQAALACLDAAGSKSLEMGDEVHWALCRIAWIPSCAWLGQIEAALQEAARAHEVLVRHEEHYWVCALDINTAVIYTQSGQYQKALDVYEKVLSVYPTLSGHDETYIKRSIGIVKNNQARNLSWLGNFEQAYRLMKEAQAIFVELEEPGNIATIETNLADLDYAQGYYSSALQRYYRVRDIFQQNELGGPLTLASVMLHTTACLVKLNKVSEALELATGSVQLYRTTGTSQDTADTLREYAITLVAAGRLKDAVVILDEAWDIFHRGGFEHDAKATKLQQAELLLEMGAVATAYDQARELKELFEKSGLVTRYARASLVMASALVARAQEASGEQESEHRSALLREATDLCEQMASFAIQHHLQEQAYKSHHLLGKLAILQGKFLDAEKYYQEAITQIEGILDTLVHDLYPSFLHTTWEVYEDMIALCLQQARPEEALLYLERARSLALLQYLKGTRKSLSQKGDTSPSLRQMESASVLRLQQEFELCKQKFHDLSVQLEDESLVDREKFQAERTRCEAKLSELFERLHLSQIETHSTLGPDRISEGKLDHAEYTDVAQLRQYLSPGQLVLSYFLHKGKLVIFALTTEQLVIHENPEGVARLEYLLPVLYASLDPKGWMNQQRPPLQATRRLLQKLYDILIAPVTSLLPPSSGALTIVPYGLLHNLPFHALHDGSRFLIEDFQIRYLPATHLLTHFDLQKPTGTHKSPLIFCYSGERRLQRALEEAKALAKIMDGHCYLESEATIARLSEQAPGCPIIHLATHGQQRLDAPNFSSVRLADGQLNAIDAFGLNLQGCELVTLSGCDTGLTLSSGGDEQLGLERAFLAAGASSLVMSLWPVEDEATYKLMGHFYQRLMNKESKAQALRAAQCDLLHQKSSVYSHPYFWAAFHLVGAVDPLAYVHEKI